jgi:hypothetical protein
LEGGLTKQAHYGTLYKAKGALFAGRACPRWLHVAPDGSVVSERMLSKIRLEERGIDYAVARLRGYGAPARRIGEDWKAWVGRVLRPPMFRRLRHPGNFAYLFGLDPLTTANLSDLHGGGQPYARACDRLPDLSSSPPGNDEARPARRTRFSASSAILFHTEAQS